MLTNTAYRTPKPQPMRRCTMLCIRKSPSVQLAIIHGLTTALHCTAARACKPCDALHVCVPGARAAAGAGQGELGSDAQLLHLSAARDAAAEDSAAGSVGRAAAAAPAAAPRQWR